MASGTEVVAKAQRRRFTAAEKLRVLREADRCTKPGELGALLRREGLYSSHISAMGLPTAIALLVIVAACCSRPLEGKSAAQPSGLRPDALAGLPPDSARLRAEPLGEGDEPSISPDGRRVAYVRWQTVWLYDLETGTTRQVCKNSNAHGVTWNPSGTLLAFQGDDSVRTYAKFWIWLVDPDGSNLRRISEGPNDEHPLWSPDGKHLVWSRAGRLWQADSTGSNGRS